MMAFIAWLVGGIATSLSAAYLKRPADLLFSRLSERFRASSQRRNDRHRRIVEHMASDDFGIAYEAIEANDDRVAGMFDLAALYVLVNFITSHELRPGAPRWLQPAMWTFAGGLGLSAMLYLRVAAEKRRLAREAVTLRLKRMVEPPRQQ